MNPTTTPTKAHGNSPRAFLLRTFAVLLIAFSIAAADPVDSLLGFAAEQIEQRASIESNIASMILVHRTHTVAPSSGDTDTYVRLEFLYRGRASAMLEIASHLRSFRSGGVEPPSIP